MATVRTQINFCRRLLFCNRFSKVAFPSFSSQATDLKKGKGLILGGYSSTNTENDVGSTKDFIWTEAAKSFNDQVANRLNDALNWSGVPKKGKARVLYGLDREFPAVAVVNLGPNPSNHAAIFQKDNVLEERDTARENLRCGIAAGLKALRDVGVDVVSVDPCGDAECAAESASLTRWQFQDLKGAAKRKPDIEVILHGSDEIGEAKWETGLTKAAGQNLARWLMEMPSNHMTPTIFARHAVDLLSRAGGNGVAINVEAHDEAWASNQGMNSFLAVAQGSREPPVFLEITYNNLPGKEKPIVIVGKGVTFDTGGISIKPAANMDKMRGDMGGAACTLATILTAAKLNLPLYIKGLIPLTENMPGGKAIKPGDVVKAMNGKTIQIDNTDAEGRLILADALAYAQQYQPNLVLDVATLTGAINVALGSSAAGVFTNSNALWHLVHQSAFITGDRVWRMPLWKHFQAALESQLADLNNVGKTGAGGSCSAAAFLKEFTDAPHWMHLDIAGVGGVVDGSDVPYLAKGMTGRPTRTLIEVLSRISQSEDFQKMF
ncbi:LOW QUALITY PROTEIN: cytosol aminopeptidase-like [Daphnia carinata]|uniref:LOW QUALITY PROTEIN: cytosol aminopeptidase-like n=1 Tax=Daphnia carinata TaxID=120202 RepID=UPI0025798F31|nr:LOW QUALITY PROTEIN: cytosol aminopeptidase-like [Daphnia carinata]